MQAITLDEDLASTVATVAKQLNTSQQAVISQAIEDYVEKINQTALNDVWYQEQAIHLKVEDMQIFLQALEDPPKANDALKDAMNFHNKLINNG